MKLYPISSREMPLANLTCRMLSLGFKETTYPLVKIGSRLPTMKLFPFFAVILSWRKAFASNHSIHIPRESLSQSNIRIPRIPEGSRQNHPINKADVVGRSARACISGTARSEHCTTKWQQVCFRVMAGVINANRCIDGSSLPLSTI